MPAATTTTTSTTSTSKTSAPSAFGYVIDTAQKSGEQILDIYLQAAKFSLDAGSAWMAALSSLPLVKSASGSAPGTAKVVAAKFASAGSDVLDHAVKVQKELSSHALTLIG